MKSPRRVIAAVCAAMVVVFLAQVAGWDFRNVPCMFRLTPGCAASSLNRSPELSSQDLKVQTIGNIKYVGADEALVEYLIEPKTATASDEANPNATQIRTAAFRKVFYRWRLEP